MRFSCLAALFLTPLACSNTKQAPAPAPDIAPGAGSAHAAPPSTILYTISTGAGRSLYAVLEDGSASRTLSTGADTTFVATLPGRKVLAAEHANQGADLSRLIVLGVDGSQQALATPAGYLVANKALPAGDGVVVEAIGTSTDLIYATPQSQTVLASRANLVAAAAGRVAYLASGTLRSIRLDGTGDLALGAGNDVVAQVAGDLVLFTSGSDARLARLDGTGTVTIANAQAFALTSDARVIYSRGNTIYSAALDGSGELALGAGKPVVMADDRVLATNGNALVSIGPAADVRVLDAQAGSLVQWPRLFGDRVVFTGETTDVVALRTARLDGGGAALLYQQDVTLPAVTGMSPDGRVVFHTVYIGELEGGRVLSVNTDGSDLRAVASDLPAVDQDFEAITPSGRLIVEVEYQGNVYGSQLLQAGVTSETAQSISDLGAVRFAALIP